MSKNDVSCQQEAQLLSLGIIGCGWLGTALAKAQLALGNEVFVTTATEQSLSVLTAQGIKGKNLLLPSNAATLVKHPVFSMAQLVIAIPPKLKAGQTDYPEKIKQLIVAAEENNIKRIVLLTSTAIYNGLSGDITEQSTLNYSAEKVAILAEAEQVVLAFSGQVTIVRLAGLVGPKRHPGRFFSGKSALTNPDAFVNLIHQQDAVGILQALLLPSAATGIFNAVSLTHPSRRDFYQAAALALNVTAPSFAKQQDSQCKVICAQKVVNQFNYRFVHDDLMAWL